MPRLTYPFQVVVHTKFYLFSLFRIAPFLIICNAFLQVFFYIMDGLLCLLLRGHEEVGRIYFVLLVGSDGIECLHI